MPEITPVVARGPPESRARMRSRLGGNGVFQHPQDFHLKFIDLVAFENGSAHAFQARANIAEREDRWARLARQEAGKKQDQHEAGKQSP